MRDASLNLRSPGGFPCAMRATGVDGKNYLAEVLDPPGFSRHGSDTDAVLKKFNSITAPHLDASARRRIIDATMGLDKASSCAELTKALTKV